MEDIHDEDEERQTDRNIIRTLIFNFVNLVNIDINY